jgi:Cys-rich repeat protein
VDRVCTLGCNGNDARCARGDVCVADACVTPCSPQNACDNGQACLDGVCVAGCLANEDCGFLTPECVGATATTTGTCLAACVNVGGTPFCAGGFVCDAAANVCVECLANDDCDAGETCDLATRRCEPTQPLCAPCNGSQDDAICGAGNLCVSRQLAEPRLTNNGIESACGTDCSDGQACPRGFGCELVVRGEVAVGAQCVPQSSVVDNPNTDFVEQMSCAGVLDDQNNQACTQNNECGDGRLLDGFCVAGVCSLRCSSDADCLAGDVCAPVIGGNGSACQ